jgi:hypothetical protein
MKQGSNVKYSSMKLDSSSYTRQRPIITPAKSPHKSFVLTQRVPF